MLTDGLFKAANAPSSVSNWAGGTLERNPFGAMR